MIDGKRTNTKAQGYRHVDRQVKNAHTKSHTNIGYTYTCILKRYTVLSRVLIWLFYHLPLRIMTGLRQYSWNPQIPSHPAHLLAFTHSTSVFPAEDFRIISSTECNNVCLRDESALLFVNDLVLFFSVVGELKKILQFQVKYRFSEGLTNQCGPLRSRIQGSIIHLVQEAHIGAEVTLLVSDRCSCHFPAHCPLCANNECTSFVLPSVHLWVGWS